MSTANITNVVSKLLDKFPGSSSVIFEDLIDNIKQCIEEGWEEADIITFFSHCEELNPDLEEEAALRVMNPIVAKYRPTRYKKDVS